MCFVFPEGPTATAPLWPLAWEPPFATGAALKRPKKKKKIVKKGKKKKEKKITRPKSVYLVGRIHISVVMGLFSWACQFFQRRFLHFFSCSELSKGESLHLCTQGEDLHSVALISLWTFVCPLLCLMTWNLNLFVFFVQRMNFLSLVRGYGRKDGLRLLLCRFQLLLISLSFVFPHLRELAPTSAS